MRIALSRDLDELAEDVLEAEGDDALLASAGQLAEWGRRYAAIGDVLSTLRSATPADREILQSVIADRVAELLGDLAGEAGDPESPIEEGDGVRAAKA